MGVNSFPEIFHMEGMAQEVCSMPMQYLMSSNRYLMAACLASKMSKFHLYCRWLVGS